MEILVGSLRSKSGPIVHAFTHALSTVIIFLREKLAQNSPRNDVRLSQVWIQYEKYENVLTALAALTDRGQDNPPHNYLALDHTSVNLLSLLYDHLHSHIERRAPQLVTAILAFTLTNTSREYFQQLSHLVGFSGDSTPRRSSRVVGEHNDQYAIDVSDDGIEERDEFDSIEDSFPTFFPPKLVDILPGAQKSLVLLRAAEPDHPLLRARSVRRVIEWFWSWDRIEAAWNGRGVAPVVQERIISPPTSRDSEPGLAQFRIFDLEPGSHFGHSILDHNHAPTPSSVLQDFSDMFPHSLPPITPTLEHLTSLVFEPLLQHASTLSRTLLSLFLSPDAPLQFKPHMELLHSYPLLASPAFKSRLAAALFSDSQGYDPDEPVPTSLRSLRRKAPIKQASMQRWPVGLSWALLERETWPPVGAYLSFFLRTVIVDSFDVNGEQLEDSSRRGTFWVEAERRLGFAIRDLPTGPGHDQWLNPLSIEALDFLYMDYKPPHPLDILITPEILSKYQRMFTHLLRIMRVEHALSSVFRMCRSTSRPLFPTLVAANKRLLHFRFIAHSFVSILSSYVFDTAIGGNVNLFLAQLDQDQEDQTPVFPDVFALAKAHAALMDDVLAACLLRTAQRGAGDLLRQALELVLEFAVLVGDVKTGRLQEYEAALMLEDLAGRFRGRMGAFTRNLKAIVDKGPLPAVPVTAALTSGPRMTGGIQAVSHLSESLSEWWTTI
ncbi:gamma-tubulin complex component protein [Roridomyces roridus]|uniref:Spindle pole body component n=1 Tax=Roridomyces roridus TaxID=1738132 RepID=A0AAD7CEK9_9AGAR|nr:gamma-tubulin complex component protein [Roridomyces roridus]